MNEFFMDQEAKRLKWSIYCIQRSKELTNFQQNQQQKCNRRNLYVYLFILLLRVDLIETAISASTTAPTTENKTKTKSCKTSVKKLYIR